MKKYKTMEYGSTWQDAKDFIVEKAAKEVLFKAEEGLKKAKEKFNTILTIKEHE